MHIDGEIDFPEMRLAFRDGCNVLAAAINRLADSVVFHANVTGTQQKRIAAALDRLAAVAERITRIHKPTGFDVSFQTEKVVMGKKIMVGELKWEAAHPSEDVDHFELIVVRDGVVETLEFDKGSTGVVPFEAPVGQTLSVELRKVDDAGNKSEPILRGPEVVVDTVAPGPAEGLAIVFTSDRVEEDPVADHGPVVDEPAPEAPADPTPPADEPVVD